MRKFSGALTHWPGRSTEQIPGYGGVEYHWASVSDSAPSFRRLTDTPCNIRHDRRYVALTTYNPRHYSRLVELFARTDRRTSRPAVARASGSPVLRLAEVAKLVQPHLEEVETRIAQQTSAFDPAIEGYVVYAVGSRGKRLRPLLALLAGGAAGNIDAGHVDLAVIVELIHIATLLHDDVMDEAEQRRAQPTANARWGNSLSVLLGDCLFAHALTLSTNFENSDIGRAIARTAATVCSGEMIQTQRRFDLNLTVSDYLRIVQMKTGSLFSTAAELAAVISETDPKVIGTFRDFGFQIGTAYQIYDDCVDLAGTESATGKTLGTDLRKGKFTLPVLIFLRSASEFERQRCCRLVLEEQIEEMIELLKNGATNGALNESITAGTDLIREAQGTLDGIASNPYGDALFSLA